MGMRHLCLVALTLAGCAGIQVDEININDPNVEINANADLEGTVNLGNEPEAVAADPAILRLQAPSEQDPNAGVPLDELSGEEPGAEQPVEPEPCSDADEDGACDAEDLCAGHDDALDHDADGLPNGCDECAAGSDADADDSGYADGCEDALWSAPLELQAAPTLFGSGGYDETGPAQIIIGAPGAECFLEGEGSGVAIVEIAPDSASPEQPFAVRLPRPTSGRAGKAIECLEAGIIGYGHAVLGGNGASGSLDSAGDLPSLTGKHIAYIKVTATAYSTSQYYQPSYGINGTSVDSFRAVVSIHGY